MKRYTSKDEILEVLRQTIATDHNGLGLSRDPKDYNLTALVRENFHRRGAGYGWGMSGDSDTFAASLRRNCRAAAPVPDRQVHPDSLRMIAADAQKFLKRDDLTPDQRLYAEALEDMAVWLAEDIRPNSRIREVLPWTED